MGLGGILRHLTASVLALPRSARKALSDPSDCLVEGVTLKQGAEAQETPDSAQGGWTDCDRLSSARESLSY